MQKKKSESYLDREIKKAQARYQKLVTKVREIEHTLAFLFLKKAKIKGK